MKVKQLIEELQKHDHETMVVISGYEDGVDEVSFASKVNIKLNAFNEWYYGKHDIAQGVDPFDCEAIFIG
jgi:hypothetical protein